MNDQQIAREILATASGRTYYENSLRAALNLPVIKSSICHRVAIQSYLRGTPASTDHIRLQEAAIMISQNRTGKEFA